MFGLYMFNVLARFKQLTVMFKFTKVNKSVYVA